MSEILHICSIPVYVHGICLYTNNSSLSLSLLMGFSCCCNMKFQRTHHRNLIYLL